MGKYTWKKIHSNDWDNYIFDTLEECIEDAKEQNCTCYIHIANVKPYKPYIWADDILEKIESEVYGDYGVDFEFKRNETVENLSKRLTEVLCQWVKETHQEPNCYDVVENTIKTYRLKGVNI